MGVGELQRRAIAGSFWTAAHTIVSVPVAFVVNAVVARVLGPVEYGGLAVLTLFLVVATHVTNAGVSDATIQWGAAADARGDRSAIARLLSGSLGYHVIVQMPLLVVTVILLSRESGIVTGIIALGVALPCIFGSASLLIAIQNRTAAGAKLAMVTNLLVQISILLTAITSESPAWVWAVRTLAGALLLPLNLLLLDRWGRCVARGLRWPRRAPTGFWRFGLLTMSSGLVSLLVFSRSEIIILDWLGDEVAVGLFALAFGVAVQITAPVDALLGPLIPATAALVAAHSDQVGPGQQRALRASSFLSGALVAGLVPVLVILLPLVYGEAYANAQAAFFVLALASSLRSVCNPLLAFLSARRQAGRLLRINVAALGLNVALAVTLIPPMGLNGALIANVCAQCLVLGLLALVEARMGDLSFRSIVGSMRAWCIGALAAAAAIASASVFGQSLLIAVGVAISASAFIFVFGIRLVSAGMLASDWLALESALPRQMSRMLRLAARLFGDSRASDPAREPPQAS